VAVSYLWLAAGGALGTLARYSLSGWVDQRWGAGAWGIFVVNIMGAFLLGLLATLAEERFLVPADLRRFVTIGFLGAYTTFSTLVYESMKMAQLGAFAEATANAVGSLVVGLAAAYLGMMLGRLI